MDSTIEVSVRVDPPVRSFREIKAEVVAIFERKFIGLVLDEYQGNLSKAAKILRTDRKHLYDMAKKHGMR